MRWIVQEYVSGENAWKDVHAPNEDPFGYVVKGWDAENADSAFARAVLHNERHKHHATSYRVLPLTGGITFNVSVHIDAEEHDAAVAQEA